MLSVCKLFDSLAPHAPRSSDVSRYPWASSKSPTYQKVSRLGKQSTLSAGEHPIPLQDIRAEVADSLRLLLLVLRSMMLLGFLGRSSLLEIIYEKQYTLHALRSTIKLKNEKGVSLRWKRFARE